jgi:hypothetical protein
VGTNAALSLPVGTQTLEASGRFEGEGDVVLSGGTLVVEGQSELKGTLRAGGGVLRFNGSDKTVSQLALSGATLTGDTLVTVTNAITWTAGVMTGAGELTVASGATLTLSANNNKWLYRTMNLAGTGSWSGSQIMARSGGVFNTLPGSVLEIHGDPDFNDGEFNNAGVLRKVSGTGISDFKRYYEQPARFHNSGLVEVLSGTLRLLGDGAHSGAFSIATDAVLDFAGGTHIFDPGAAFSGQGSLLVQTPITLNTNLDFNALHVVFQGAASITGEVTLTVGEGGTLTFAKSMTVPGSVIVEGTLTLSADNLTVTINGTLTLEATGTLNNPGTLNVGVFADNGGTVVGNAPVEIGASPSSITIQAFQLEHDAQSSSVHVHLRRPPLVRVILSVEAPSGAILSVETSEDLRSWAEVEAVVVEPTPGRHEIELTEPSTGRSFFRVRCWLQDQPERVSDNER